MDWIDFLDTNQSEVRSPKSEVRRTSSCIVFLTHFIILQLLTSVFRLLTQIHLKLITYIFLILK